jgi:hypothetical protein
VAEVGDGDRLAVDVAGELGDLLVRQAQERLEQAQVSVDGWMVSPRKSRRKSACFSSTMTSTPARASR